MQRDVYLYNTSTYDPRFSLVSAVEWAVLVAIVYAHVFYLDKWDLPSELYLINIHILQLLAFPRDAERRWKHGLVLLVDLLAFGFQVGLHLKHVESSRIYTRYSDDWEYFMMGTLFLLVAVTTVRFVSASADLDRGRLLAEEEMLLRRQEQMLDPDGRAIAARKLQGRRIVYRPA